MFVDLNTYSAYKPSGVEWLGDVPEHWEQRSLWTVSEPRVEKNPGGLQLLSVFLNRGVIRYEEGGGQVHAPSLDLTNYQVVHPGDFVLNNQQAWRGSVGVSRHHGIVSPAYIVLRLVGLDAAYADYLFQCPAMVNQFVTASKGVGDIQRQIYWPLLRFVQTLLPPLSEQAAIVRYLDHADRRIRRYIGAKKKLIKLLEEQKQALIHRAVTRGLDPNVHLKPSGMEWLGDVPEHWELRPAKWYFQEADERSETGSEELLSVSHITGVTPRSEKNITMFKAASNIGHKLCRPGDLVINTMWAWMAALGVASRAGIVSPSYAVYRPHRSSRLLDAYADLLLRTAPYKSEYICRSTGIRSSRLRMYPEEFLRIKLLCPPLEVQRAIVEVVSKESTAARRAIDLAYDELSLLREYRTRLIADVVTGKLDVREEVDRMPDEAEKPEPIDEEWSEPADNYIELPEALH